jgi:hypothetical protein
VTSAVQIDPTEGPKHLLPKPTVSTRIILPKVLQEFDLTPEDQYHQQISKASLRKATTSRLATPRVPHHRQNPSPSLRSSLTRLIAAPDCFRSLSSKDHHPSAEQILPALHGCSLIEEHQLAASRCRAGPEKQERWTTDTDHGPPQAAATMTHEPRLASSPLHSSQRTPPILEVRLIPTLLPVMAASTSHLRDIHIETTPMAAICLALNTPSVPTTDRGITPPCQPRDVGH